MISVKSLLAAVKAFIGFLPAYRRRSLLLIKIQSVGMRRWAWVQEASAPFQERPAGVSSWTGPEGSRAAAAWGFYPG